MPNRFRPFRCILEVRKTLKLNCKVFHSLIHPIKCKFEHVAVLQSTQNAFKLIQRILLPHARSKNCPNRTSGAEDTVLQLPWRFLKNWKSLLRRIKLKLNSLSSWQANTLSTGGQGGKEGHPPPGQNQYSPPLSRENTPLPSGMDLTTSLFCPWPKFPIS